MLTGELRSLDEAEEALQEAYARAVLTWPRQGTPANPAAWLLTCARRCAIDRRRRAATATAKLPLLAVGAAPGGDGEAYDVPDDRLRLVFTCCHPALSPATRVALTLRYVAGLSTAQVARLLLSGRTTMAQRLTRAKRKIAEARIPYRVPACGELPERLGAVCAVVYLVFTEGYRAGGGDGLMRVELAGEAVRLARLLRELMPGETEVTGLLALLLFQHSRRDTRVDADGDLVLLGDQDRSRWHRGEIDEAAALLAGIDDSVAGRYVLEARIAACHATAPAAAGTDWPRIAGLYARLEELTGSPVVRLNRAVAVAETGDLTGALVMLDGLDAALPASHLLPAARADLLLRAGRAHEAAGAYRRAIDLAPTAPERRFLHRRLTGLDAAGVTRPAPPSKGAS